MTTEIDKVKAQNEEIKELDKKKDRLLARKKVIEELQANRSQMVHLFDSLVRTIPRWRGADQHQAGWRHSHAGRSLAIECAGQCVHAQAGKLGLDD